MSKPDAPAIVISLLLAALVHRAGAQKSQVGRSATRGPSPPSAHAAWLGETKLSIVMLSKEADLQSLLDRPIPAEKAGQRPPPPQGAGALRPKAVSAGTRPMNGAKNSSIFKV